MQRKKLAAIATATLAGAAMMLPLTAPQVNAAPAASKAPAAAAPDKDHDHGTGDNLLQPWQRKYEAIRKAGVEQRLRSGGDAKVQKLAKGQFAQTAAVGNDKVFVILAEFGDTRHSAYCDSTEEGSCAVPSDGTPLTYDGPAHNAIPEPDRSKDNSTLWKPNYSRAHYQNMYFNRLDTFFKDQSSGKYRINGDVTEWVKVPFNEARYGRDGACGSNVCNNTWFLLRDGLAQWTQDRLDAGMTMPEIQDYLKTFDKQDRYDFDDDGNFKEPDGYIDHMQIVHAGGDQADGDPNQGTDAIWSHRWYAQINPRFTSGPADGAQLGGIEIGEGGVSDPSGSNVQIPDNPTGVWIGDYTIQPENGGLSVFAHEYVHDLGLPDLYDTSGNTGGAENSSRFWTLMSQSRGTLPGDAGIGDRPMPLGAWDKYQLGWLDAAVVKPGKSRTVKLRPGQQKGTNPNGIVVRLPDKKIRQNLGASCGEECGDRYFYSDKGNDLDNNMKRAVDGGGELTAKVKYEIEDGWDYAFLEVSSDNGGSWQQIDTSENYEGDDQSGYDPNDVGISGNTEGEWVDLTATVPDGTNAIRWRYITDGAFVLDGLQLDNITLDGEVIGDAETQDEGWTYRGFQNTGGNDLVSYTNAYFVDNRSVHKGLDKPLSHLYNFGFPNPNRVEFFHYNKGALITYWDASYTDNNVGDHPGHGEILPVDVNPGFVHTPDGALMRPGFASWDAALSDKSSKKQTLRFQGQKFTLPARKAVRLFDDTRRYWSDSDQHGAGEHAGHYQPGWYSVDVPRTGTTIRVIKTTKKGVMWIKVN
jgi:immune inhibitor A